VFLAHSTPAAEYLETKAIMSMTMWTLLVQQQWRQQRQVLRAGTKTATARRRDWTVRMKKTYALKLYIMLQLVSPSEPKISISNPVKSASLSAASLSAS